MQTETFFKLHGLYRNFLEVYYGCRFRVVHLNANQFPVCQLVPNLHFVVQTIIKHRQQNHPVYLAASCRVYYGNYQILDSLH